MKRMELLLHIHELCVTIGEGLCYLSEHPGDKQVKEDIKFGMEAVSPLVSAEVLGELQGLFSDAAGIGPGEIVAQYAKL